MRRPFFMDDLSPDDQRKVRRMFFGVLFGYTAIVALVFAIVIVRRQLSDDGVNAKPCVAARATPDAPSHARGTDCAHDVKARTSFLISRDTASR
jgi:hypothetical protein